jgi:hypothetical protein
MRIIDFGISYTTSRGVIAIEMPAKKKSRLSTRKIFNAEKKEARIKEKREISRAEVAINRVSPGSLSGANEWFGD